MVKDSFQLTDAAAQKYQAHSVPAMFEPLAKATLAKIALPEHARVVDIACGTGALTREITRALPGQGRIAGCDLNETMIAVAEEMQPASAHDISWHTADVCALPFADQAFDMAFVQQGLQFFPDKPRALAEIHRVLVHGGLLVLTCWRAISPFNNALAEALAEHVGEDAATKARAPFSFRDGPVIAGLLTDAGFEIQRHEAIVLQRRFEDLRAQILALPVEKDLREAGAKTTDRTIADTARRLAGYDRGGIFVVPQEAHLFCASRV